MPGTRCLSARYTLVKQSAPQTLRIHLTLAGAKTITLVVGAVTKVDLMVGPYNAIQTARGKEVMFSGSVNCAVKIYDAQTNKLPAAYVAKHYHWRSRTSAALTNRESY